MDIKEQLKSKSLSELFMLIRNGSGAMALSASEEIERRLSAQHTLAADGAVCDLDHDMLALEGHSTCPNCGAIPPRR